MCNCEATSAQKLTEEDENWLVKTEEFRKKYILNKPRHSNFVVTATVVFFNQSKNVEGFIQGTNYEPCWIGGSICAERCALMSLRVSNQDNDDIIVKSIYITSDSDSVITPGVMCREFIFSSPQVDPSKTAIVAGNAGLKQTVKYPVCFFYPYPFVFSRCTRQESLQLKQTLVLPVKLMQSKFEMYPSAEIVYQKAALLARSENHTLSCAGCCLLSDGTMFTSLERRYLEYANSLDAITQLADRIETYLKEHLDCFVSAICQVDSSGFAHAPFAPGRGFLQQFGHLKAFIPCHCLEAENVVSFHVVTSDNLTPLQPKLEDVL